MGGAWYKQVTLLTIHNRDYSKYAFFVLLSSKGSPKIGWGVDHVEGETQGSLRVGILTRGEVLSPKGQRLTYWCVWGAISPGKGQDVQLLTLVVLDEWVIACGIIKMKPSAW